ncbi:MAG: glycosyltransferase family 4 protein [Candidatus Doudnabacteria bacterium]
MMKNKILFICTGISKELSKGGFSGGEVRLAEIIRGALKNNWETHLLVSSGGETFCRIFNLKNVITYNLFQKRNYAGKLDYVFLSLKLLFWIPKQLKKFREGVIYSANELLWDIIPALKLKCMSKKIKWAAVVHWVPGLKFWRRQESKLIYSLLFLIAERISVLLIKYFAQTIFAVSETTAEQLYKLKITHRKIFPVKCGIHLQKINHLASQIHEKKYTAVFMKRIQAVKGVFDLIPIWQQVMQKNPNAQLIIIGGGEDEKALRTRIKEQKLEKNILFLGPILDFECKIKTLSQARLFILPSYEENWAIVIGEAMACRLPVIAYALPALTMVWQDNFISVPVGKKDEFAMKINHYLKNDLLRKKQAEAGYQYVQQFDWNKIAQTEINLLKKL